MSWTFPWSKKLRTKEAERREPEVEHMKMQIRSAIGDLHGSMDDLSEAINNMREKIKAPEANNGHS